mgnify:CR=1 FL=1
MRSATSVTLCSWRNGSVTSTSPAASTTVDAGSAIDYVLSLGIEQVTVPDVVDSTEADATTAIETAGLTVGATTTAFDETIAAAETLLGGAEVRVATTVLVGVDVQITFRGDRQVDEPVASDLIEHVLEERHPGVEFGLAAAVEVDRHGDLRLQGVAFNTGAAAHRHVLGV